MSCGLQTSSNCTSFRRFALTSTSFPAWTKTTSSCSWKTPLPNCWAVKNKTSKWITNQMQTKNSKNSKSSQKTFGTTSSTTASRSAPKTLSTWCTPRTAKWWTCLKMSLMKSLKELSRYNRGCRFQITLSSCSDTKSWTVYLSTMISKSRKW